MLRFVSLVIVAIATPAVAADQPTPRIVVTGTGTVQTSPELATITFSIRGEGSSSELALAALVQKRAAIAAGLNSMSGAPVATGGDLSIHEVRGRDCKSDDDDRPQLSKGACAIDGYVATVPQTVRTTAVKDAATMTGYIAQLGGSDPEVQSYGLRDQVAAKNRAIAAALADARQKAEAIANGSRVRLGMLLNVSDSSNDRGEDIVVTGSRIAAASPPPPAVIVDVMPRPIETQATVTVTYAIAGG